MGLFFSCPPPARGGSGGVPWGGISSPGPPQGSHFPIGFGFGADGAAMAEEQRDLISDRGSGVVPMGDTQRCWGGPRGGAQGDRVVWGSWGHAGGLNGVRLSEGGRGVAMGWKGSRHGYGAAWCGYGVGADWGPRGGHGGFFGVIGAWGGYGVGGFTVWWWSSGVTAWLRGGWGHGVAVGLRASCAGCGVWGGHGVAVG